MLITCRKCGKRYKMPSKPLEQLPEAVQCKNCRSIIPVKETVRKAIAKKRGMRKVTCQDCGKQYRLSIENLPRHVTTTKCRACGGTVPLPSLNPKKEPTPSLVDNFFSDASLNDTMGAGDISGLLTRGSGALTHSDSSGAETLPLTDPLNGLDEFEGRGDTEVVQIDFDKVIRLIKVLIVGAIIIVVVGMSITHIRICINRKVAERNGSKAAQRVEEPHRTSQTPNKRVESNGQNERSEIEEPSSSKSDPNTP